ncbi:hypothetical protein HNR77_004237 [Paenibacillus sp. JGP012]|uniref:hypothetical protein n=1 Tax=Paenibacillus sp. JGP012 TaxID=2735914 RepID=UPI001607E6A8|nr:hypothetical protein [Paenibacillus sp. JGP012]MBB6023137.1 hypothetical protein [Paenibacillus sp. JGP012]
MISIFLSYPQPHKQEQNEFIGGFIEYLKNKDITPRTLGVTDYDNNNPLAAIRRLMLESDGFITVAFRRLYVNKGVSKFETDIESTEETEVSDKWFTSPYCQIETAMAYQLGLPILSLLEKGVTAEGVLQKGVVGLYLPEFVSSVSVQHYLSLSDWKQTMAQWEANVVTVNRAKGFPRQLY